MGVFSENAIIGASAAGGYDIEQSLRFEDGDSAYLSRTPSSVGNRKTWTMSFWVKRANIDTSQHCNIISVYASGSDSGYFSVEFLKSGTNEDKFRISGWSNSFLITQRVFRDPGAWYHFVVRVDTTNSTANDRVRVYVNGTQETSFTNRTNPSLNDDLGINQTSAHHIGEEISGSEHLDGYLAEFNFIDGQSLTPASFGETNLDTNQWQAIKYAGSYGTNGFYLKFQDSSALGDDSSGNTNDFTPTNLAATDQVLDSPTNNFATINGLTESIANRNDFFEGNLRAKANDISGNSSAWFTATMGIPPNTGKYYWEFADEVYIDADTFGGAYPDGWGIGLLADDGHTSLMADTDIGNTGWWFSKSNNNVGTARARGGGTSSENKRVPSTSTGVFKCCYDSDAGSFWFGGDLGWMTKTSTSTPETSAQPGSGNDLWDSGTGTGFAGYTVVPAWATINAGGNLTQLRFNFGQDSTFAGLRSGVSGTAGNPGGGGYGGNADTNGFGDFFYEVPTGFKALCSDNLPDPAIADPTAHFNTKLYTGTAAELAVTGVGFQPDFTWIKTRALTYNHRVFDVVRGVTKEVYTNVANAEVTDAQSLKSFDSDGFTLGTGSGSNPSSTMVSWNWKAGGAASSNSDGSTTSSVSVNTTAGFSIVSYAGSGSAGATVGHGLSQTPDLIIIKNRSAITNWVVNSPITNSGFTEWALKLDLDQATSTDSTIWNNTAPTSSVFTLGTAGESNRNNPDNYIAYCFHSVDGYSKVGKYEGNGNTNGPFVYTGFRPAFIMVKLVTAASGYWVMFDNKRDPDNPTGRVFYANETSISTDVSSYAPYDLLSNGFKSRIPGGNGNEASYNTSGQTYLYLAFAESPFKTANAR